MGKASVSELDEMLHLVIICLKTVRCCRILKLQVVVGVVVGVVVVLSVYSV